ncbi:hypothetical protein G3A56_02025 [Rhizobium oryzihabitans]|uniref:Uncharacterized protein n=1 Tax=Rhizobium oryzihabitans TaxID=2267833 RepID=A0A7L5BDM1_9HYPH|nr:hypothetical protein [Rhizobium oryzihabitans]QIB36921.1 hypothetical protein G3A56_02025 [Rhizobium oryzihabitans]
MDAFSTTNTQEADDPTEIYIELGNHIRRIDTSTKSFKRRFRAVIAVMLTVCGVSASWAFIGIPKYQRMALINQEVTVAWKR